MSDKIKSGQQVWIRPEYRDAGDDSFRIIAVEDEDGGRVRIQFCSDLPINGQQVIPVSMLSVTEI